MDAERSREIERSYATGCTRSHALALQLAIRRLAALFFDQPTSKVLKRALEESARYDLGSIRYGKGWGRLRTGMSELRPHGCAT